MDASRKTRLSYKTTNKRKKVSKEQTAGRGRSSRKSMCWLEFDLVQVNPYSRRLGVGLSR
jgi:hypothetical protein